MENLSFVRYMRMDRVSNDCIRELVGVMGGNGGNKDTEDA